MHFAVVNIPDNAAEDGTLAASVGGSPHHVSFPRISSFTGSDGNRRRRRKPFKSSSNHSLQAMHPHMPCHHAHDASGLQRSSGPESQEASGLHLSSGPESHDASGLHRSSGPESHDGSQHSYSTYAASHDAPVHGFRVQPPEGRNPASYDYSSNSPRWEMKVDGMVDEEASSAADSMQTSVTTSSTSGVDREQKRLINNEREKHAKM